MIILRDRPGTVLGRGPDKNKILDDRELLPYDDDISVDG